MIRWLPSFVLLVAWVGVMLRSAYWKRWSKNRTTWTRQAGAELRPHGFVMNKATARPFRVEWTHPDGLSAVIEDSQ